MALAALSLTAACARDDEAAMRARLDQWFSLGETVGFSATRECAAGAFRLVEPSIRAPMPVTSGAREMLHRLDQSGRAALDDRRQAPDAGLIALINEDRASGMQVRRAALEGRGCMDATVESAFRYALDEPRSVLAFDRDSGSLMILDPVTGLVVVTVGAR